MQEQVIHTTNERVIVYDPRAIAIGATYAKAKKDIGNSNKFYIECGGALLKVKEELAEETGNKKRVGFIDWLKANYGALGFTRQAAFLLMKAYPRRAELLAKNAEDPIWVSREIWNHGPDPYRTQGTGNEEWHTPERYIALARAVLGTIDLDPASNAEANRTVKAAKFFTKEQDGLSKPWRGKVWLNPPYAQPTIENMISKLVQEHRSGNVPEAVLLTHNSMDTAWAHEAMGASPVFCFTSGRINFTPPANREPKAAMPAQGQCFYYYGRRPHVFIEHFTEIGFMARAY